jgi:hypothetical protein
MTDMGGNIDKTFTKKDLLEFIDIYDMEIEDPSSLSKKDLQNEIEKYLDTLTELPFTTEYDFIEPEDLLLYLQNEKPNIDLNYREKGDMIALAKKILHYTRNGYSIALTNFKDIDEIYQKGILVANHGDIPTCRRAITELNKDQKIRTKLDVKISLKVQNELEQKEINKKSLTPQCKFNRKYTVLNFD